MMKPQAQARVEVHRLMDCVAQRGGSLEDVTDAIEADMELLTAFVAYDDPEFEVPKTRLEMAWARRRAEAI